MFETSTDDHVALAAGSGSGAIHPGRNRGEVVAWINGQRYELCLTLGALAELEARLGGGALFDISKRWACGNLTASQLLAILGAAFRGGGNDVSDDDLARMHVEGGLGPVAKLVERLLEVTFPKVS